MPAAPAFSTVTRAHAADDVFHQLSTAILKGQIAVGATLPPERLLAAEFGVSRIIARQAVHRLAELGLARVRQGGSTVVLDPNEATDLRVIEMMYRLGPSSAADLAQFTERQVLNGHVLLMIAARRASTAERAGLANIIEEYCAAGGAESGLAAFEERFWRAVARAGKNRFCIFEVNWWFRLLADQPRAKHAIVAPPNVRVAVLRELGRRLVKNDDAAAFYLEVFTRVIDHTPVPARRKPRRVK